MPLPARIGKYEIVDTFGKSGDRSLHSRLGYHVATALPWR